MSGRVEPRPWILLVLLVAPVVSGCLASDVGGAATQSLSSAFRTTFRVLNASSLEPVFLAQITVLAGAVPHLVVATDQNGTAPLEITPGVTGYEVRADGFLRAEGGIAAPVDVIVVKLAPVSAAAENLSQGVGLRFRAPVDLKSRSYGPTAGGTSCTDVTDDRDGDCGLSEPSVEVDALGQIYVSGVCCIGGPPPVYVSRDDGATFQELTTATGVRERFGIEGDFAIDAAGTLYFSDIELAASFQLTAWDKDGKFLRHTKWPARPLVDRDWIRAEGNGKLYYVYNTGSSTEVFTSQDGGASWSPTAVRSINYPLGNAVKGPKAGELWILGGSADNRRLADYTLDGGATWKREISTAPTRGGFPTGAFDDAGNLYVAGVSQDMIQVARRDVDGNWHPALNASPEIGHHRMPWLAAGGAGKVAVAWYGTLEEGEQSRWYLFVAVSLDADSPTPHWQVAIADPEPVIVGNLGRQLLDFLQIEIGPDAAIHVAYAKLRAKDGSEEQLHYVHSEPTLPLASAAYANGPRSTAP